MTMSEIGIFEFANPEWLWLLVVVPVIVVGYWLTRLWEQRKLRRFGNRATLVELMPERSRARGWIKVSLFALAVGFAVVALARPQTGVKLRSVETEGREIVLVVDVSNSMLAEDTEPSRMARTRHAIQQLTRHMTNDHVGIVAFADDVEVLLPITSDYKMAESKLRNLSPALIANQGTDVGEALETALLSFSNNTRTSHSRVIILITDGEAHDNKALSVAERAKEEGVVICCIGIGTPEGTALKIDGKMIEDEDGKMVVTKLNEQLLNDIASAAGGVYIRSTNSSFGLEEIVAELDKLGTTELSLRNFEEYDEEYMWFLGAALLLLLVESLVLGRRNPLLKGVTLFEREKVNK
jgi:Ca-activated chloride channel family protein